MGLTRTNNTTLVVSPSGAKDFLRIDSDHEDALIETLIVTAQDFVERETSTTICGSEYTLTLDDWPQCREIRLPRPPLLDVDQVTYRSAGGSQLVLPTSSYFVDASVRPGRLVFTGTLPAVADMPAAIEIDFVAGYDESQVPPTLVHAVKLLIGHWYEHREAATDRRIDEVPLAVQRLIQMHSYPQAVG